MKRYLKKLVVILLLVFVAIQFIRPARNKSDKILPTDISKLVNVPADVQVVLQNACLDCHSNKTIYPWYAHVQPVAWLLSKHIREGKEVLNFSDFGSYSSRRQISKLTGVANSIKDGSMPTSSYKRMHKKARLSDEQKKIIINWSESSKGSLSIKNN